MQKTDFHNSVFYLRLHDVECCQTLLKLGDEIAFSWHSH
jgi:hypothetical protein